MLRRVLSSAIVLAFLGAVWFLFSQIPSVADVQPHEQGVVVSSGQVIGILPPGLHPFDARTQEVFVYETLLQREYQLPEAINVAGCPSDVRIIWGIEDVEAWHSAIDRTNVGPALATEVRRLAQTLTEFGGDPRSEMQVFVNVQMEDFRAYGAARHLVVFGEPQC